MRMLKELNKKFHMVKVPDSEYSRWPMSTVVTDKTPFFVIGSFCTHHSICLNIGF